MRIHDLCFGYQGTELLFDGLCASFDDGRIHTLLGPSGSGKTTLVYLASGLLRPLRGEITIREDAPGGTSALILQEYGLLPWKRVYENVSLGLQIKQLPTSQIARKVEPILEELGIAHLAKRYPKAISGGERQRVAIARALVTEPDLLLMDEPFASLDSQLREEMQELVKRLCSDHSMTMLLVTHSIEEAAYLSDEVHILTKKGQGGATTILSFCQEPGKKERNTPEHFRSAALIRQHLQEAVR